MRVLFVARWYPSHDSPGRGSFVADQVRALTQAGVDVVVASWEPALLSSVGDAGPVSGKLGTAAGRVPLRLATPRTWGAGVPVVRLAAVVPSDPLARHPVDLAAWQAATLVPFAETLAATWPIDLIHAHTGLPDGVAAAVAADRLGVPLVTTEHDSRLDVRVADERAKEAYRTLSGPRRQLIAVSARLASQIAELAGIPHADIDVIPNLVDLAIFAPDPAIRRDPNELLWVGNRKASKGMVELLHAFARVAGRRPELRLRLIGRAPTPADDDALRTLAGELDIAARVALEDPMPRAGVAAAMARAGLFVHPSPFESFGIVAVEALAAGLPVVAVSPFVLDNIGRDGSLGEASDGPDAGALGDAIERALGRLDGFDRTALIAAARPFGAEVVTARILETYRAAIGQSGADTGAATEALALVAAPAPARTLVVATRRRSAVDRVAHLGPATVATLTIVTAVATSQAAGTAPTSAPAPFPETWIEVDPDAAYRAGLARLGLTATRQPARGRVRRLLDAARHPLRTIARRDLARRRPDLAAAAWTAALTTAAADLDRGTPVIALDCDDVAVVEHAGLLDRLIPVGLRWIADRHDEREP